MQEYSVLIGGKAGYGIDKAGSLIAGMLNRMGYRIYVYRDYPSVIRGGHTYSIIRASEKEVSAHRNAIDFLLALNQDTFTFHLERLKPGGTIVYDSESVTLGSLPPGVKVSAVPIGAIIKEESASEIMRNSCIIGCFCKAAGIPWAMLEEAFRKDIAKESELNLKVAQRGFAAGEKFTALKPVAGARVGFLTGNEALSLGLVAAGLQAYLAYPMTPSSGVLHFMAQAAGEFGLTVMHPESEISVMMMALGFAYAGKRVAVGTSGGGFCLMTEGLSFAGMSELPIVIVMGQRTGPSTGLPTYTGQSELNFVCNAGHGEFPRFIAAPGDAQEAYFWSGAALNFAWKFQMPAFILTDKTLAEGAYSFDPAAAGEVAQGPFAAWDGEGAYKRYAFTENGVSPLAFVPAKGATIKVNSYEHDESGITTEDPRIAAAMQEKRLRKEQGLVRELDAYQTVKVYGRPDATQAILCWGSNKGVCIEVADALGIKVIHPNVLWPFPLERFRAAARGLKQIICVENNATGQLANLLARYGVTVSERVLKYDGRPFTVDELEQKVARCTR